MDANFYYQAIDSMEKAGVCAEYMQGWIGGYMGNPLREEQRLTPAYEAGYADGQEGEVSGYGDWLQTA